MAEEKNDKKNEIPNERLQEKFSHKLNFIAMHAKAASINAKLGAIYPESFMAAYMNTGSHVVSNALVAAGGQLKPLLDRFKKELQLKGSGDNQDYSMNIDKDVWAAMRLAYKLALKANEEKIQIEHMCLSLINVSENIVSILKEANVNIEKLVKELEKSNANDSKQKKEKPEKQIKNEVIENMCINITEKAKKGLLDPILARDEEIEEAITILCRRHKRNPLMIGPAGVGKTAVIDGIAQRIVSNTVPHKLKNCKIYNLTISDLVSGTKYRGEFESKIQNLIKEAENDPNIIIFIDEIHTIVGAGTSGAGSLDAANILKPALARGLRCIGATTNYDYKKHIEGDGALERRFEKVYINEPNEEQVRQILNGIKHRLEEYHSCTILPESIDETIRLSARYLTDSHFPDKAIACLDTACAKYAWSNTNKAVITSDDIVSVISKRAKIPKEIISLNNYEKLTLIEKTLKSKVVGQDRAIEGICRVMRSAYSGTRNQNKPIGVFVFGGETATGKTFTATELGSAVFSTSNPIIRLDMSEYSEKHTVSRIIGSPPGYVGYEDSETILDQVRRTPYCVFLLDEVEKAHPQVMKLFLQVMKDGHITDSSGNKVNCKNLIIVMTGNFNLNENKTSRLGFIHDETKAKTAYDLEKEKLVKQCKDLFGGEFVNRVDDFVFFEPLSKETLLTIAKAHLEELLNRVTSDRICVKFSDLIPERLIELKEKEHGANAMMLDRLINKLIEPVLSDAILKIPYDSKDRHVIEVILDGDGFASKTSIVLNGNEEINLDKKEIAVAEERDIVVSDSQAVATSEPKVRKTRKPKTE